MSTTIENRTAAPLAFSPSADDYRAFLLKQKSWASLEGTEAEESCAIAEMGCALAQAGRLDEALILFEGLVAGDPDDAPFRAALATVYHKLHRHPEARAEYEAALALDPDNVIALAGRGELLLRAGEREGREDLLRARSLDPSGYTGASQRAEALLQNLVEQRNG